MKGAKQGKLQGRTVVLKDNICLAGIPMMSGSRVLEGYIPDMDATIVTRILDAGGTIVGKAVCEDLCWSCGSHTSATGPVRNPHDETMMAGGSSSGCAALVWRKVHIASEQISSFSRFMSWLSLALARQMHALRLQTVPNLSQLSVETSWSLGRVRMGRGESRVIPLG